MKTNHQYNYNYKLDELYSREKSYDLHKRKLAEIRTKKSQSVHSHIQVLEKRNLLREQRRRFDMSEKSDCINKGNTQLYQKITEICHRPMNAEYFKYEDEKVSHNLNLTYRRIQAQQIQCENIKLASRLIKQEPVLKINELNQSYLDNQRLMLRLLKYQQSQNYVTQLRQLNNQISKRKHNITLPKTSREAQNLSVNAIQRKLNTQSKQEQLPSLAHDSIKIQKSEKSEKSETPQQQELVVHSDQIPDSNQQGELIN